MIRGIVLMFLIAVAALAAGADIWKIHNGQSLKSHMLANIQAYYH